MGRDEEIAELKRRLAALEAGQDPDAVVVPPLTSEIGGRVSAAALGADKSAVWGKIAVLVVLVVGAVFVVNSVREPTAKPAANDNPNWKAEALAMKPGEPFGKPATPTAPRTAWVYDAVEDPMSGKSVLYGCVTSHDQVLLESPYSPVTATLCLRRKPSSGLDAYYSLDGDGQIICNSYQGCTIRARFDEDPQESFSGGEPADHSSNMVFIQNAPRLAERLKTADKTLLQVTFYQAGTQAVTFNTAGFDPSKLGLKSPAKAKPKA